MVLSVCAILCPQTDISAQAPVNGQPLMAGGPDGLSPMSFGLTYSNNPRGFAFVSSKTQPDLFVLISHGTAEAKGFWRCCADGFHSDGSAIYGNPVRVKTPWDGDKPFPTRIKVFQDGDDIYLIRLTSKTLKVARWVGNDEFELCADTSLEGIEYPLAGFDVIRRSRSEIELAFLCTDGKSYRPKMEKGDTRSYYNGAEIYRGELPSAGLFRLSLNNDWTQTGRVEMVSDDMNIAVGAGELGCVRSADGRLDGYLFTNRLGSMKYIPYLKRLPAGGIHPLHVRKDEHNIRVHSSYSSRLISLASKPGDCESLLIGGESAMYTYRFEGFTAKGEPLYNAQRPVLERHAPVYGSSLTVPNVVDWDGDGVLDIVAGNSEGRLLFFKNRGTDAVPDFAMSEELCAGGEPICLRPGYHVVQGPFEASWGYLCPTVFDWNQDGLLDVVVSGSRAKFEVMLNAGTAGKPELAAPYALSFDNLELYGTWRVRPAIAKVGDDIVMVIMDGDNALHMYRKIDDRNVEDAGKLRLTDGSFITGHNQAGELMGQWGRGKLRFFDWDNDGDLDLFIGSIKRSSYPSPERGLPYARFLKKQNGLQCMLLLNAGTDENMVFEYPVQFQVDGKDLYLGAHSNAPEPCMLGDTSGGANLLVGVESGKYFFFERKHLTTIGLDDIE